MGLIGLIKAIGLDIAHDARNRHPGRVRPASTKLDAPSDRIFIRPVTTRHRFINQSHARSPVLIARGEEAPAHKRSP
jgi:hypothetical protein